MRKHKLIKQPAYKACHSHVRCDEQQGILHSWRLWPSASRFCITYVLADNPHGIFGNEQVPGLKRHKGSQNEEKDSHPAASRLRLSAQKSE